MAQYTLYTSGPYKQNNGSAITSTSTDINLGTAKKVRDSVVLNRVENLTGQAGFSDVKGGVDGVGVADTQDGVTVSVFGTHTNNLLIAVFGSAHSLAVGDFVGFPTEAEFTQSMYRVVTVLSDTDVVLNILATSDILALTSIASKIKKGTFATQGDENFIMMKNDATVHGQANSTLAAGASDYGRVKIAKFDISPKTTKTATAIRTDKYNSYNGTFDAGYPQTVTDSINADDETVDSTTKIGVKGELTFRSGGANPTSADYRAKTN